MDEDIVDRLRVLNFMGPWKEAADEIERLREASADIGLQRDDAWDDGFAVGYSRGEDEGLKTGYKNGYEAALKEKE